MARSDMALCRIVSYRVMLYEAVLSQELEKVLPKSKGVIFQAVKEVLETLVAENKIQQEKVCLQDLFRCDVVRHDVKLEVCGMHGVCSAGWYGMVWCGMVL